MSIARWVLVFNDVWYAHEMGTVSQLEKDYKHCCLWKCALFCRRSKDFQVFVTETIHSFRVLWSWWDVGDSDLRSLCGAYGSSRSVVVCEVLIGVQRLCGRCSCRKCGEFLNVSSNDLYPPDTYFEAGNRGTLSFMEVDMSKFRKQKEKKWRSCFPFFDSLDSWGIQRKRTQLRCVSCNMLLGYIYYDMPRRAGGGGHSGWGPSQAVPRGERYRLKIKALQEAPLFHHKWQWQFAGAVVLG